MMRQKATGVYRDVGLQYRMWARSLFWYLVFRGGCKYFWNLL